MKTCSPCFNVGSLALLIAVLFFQNTVIAWDTKSKSAAGNNPYHSALVQVDEMKKMPLPMSPTARENLNEELDALGAQIAMGLDPAKVQAAIQRTNELYKTFTEVPEPVKVPVTEMEAPPHSPFHGDPMQSVGPSGETVEPANTNSPPPPRAIAPPEEELRPDVGLESHDAGQEHEPVHPADGGGTPHEPSGNQPGGESHGGGHSDHCM